MPLSQHEIKRYFPNASASTLRANSAHALPASDKEPTQGRPLERIPKRKKKSSPSTAQRIGLLFRVYALRPADADGWAFKEIIDALSGAEILDGDGWDRCYIAGIFSEKVQSKNQERTEVTILYPCSAEATSTPVLTPRQALIEQLWLTARHTWNRPAFDVFCETLSTVDLQQQIQNGRA